MYGIMIEATKRQRQVLDFVQRYQQVGQPSPTVREIAAHFGFRSPRAAQDHLAALERKGLLDRMPGKARSLRAVTPLQMLRKRIVDIPLFGSVPAGFGQERMQEANGCVSIDIQSLGVKPSPVAFALEVKGDSMIGKLIAPGDMVVIEPRAEPKAGDVVVALIDGESTLKTFMLHRGKPYLRAENPRYPNLVPAHELVIQGVMVALIRKRR